MFISITCDSNLNQIFYVLKQILNIIMIVAPILLIIMASVHLFNLVRDPDNKKLLPKIRNAFIACVVLFFIPLLINVTMYFVGNKSDFSSCWNNAKKQSLAKDYIKVEDKDSQKILNESKDYEKGVPKKLNLTCTSSIIKSQFSCDTLKIVEKHYKDFNYNNFRTVIDSYGGFDNYVKSLGGVFAQYYGKELNIKTESEFQRVSEYVFGFMYMYGTDYLNGGGEYQGWGVGLGQSGHSDDAFYPGNMRAPHSTDWFDAEFDQVISGTGKHQDLAIATECGPAAQTPLYKGGILKRGQTPNRTMVTRFRDLRPGDLFHIFDHPVDRGNRGSWGQGVHVAIVGEVYDDRIVIYDGGRYFQTTRNFKRTIKMVDTEAEEYAEIRREFGHDYWASERFKELKKA